MGRASGYSWCWAMIIVLPVVAPVFAQEPAEEQKAKVAAEVSWTTLLERDISSLIISAERGDGQAANALFVALYE